MSKESYSIGFCKAAMASGVDPLALAEIKLSMMEKFAQFTPTPDGVGVIPKKPVPTQKNPKPTHGNPKPTQESTSLDGSGKNALGSKSNGDIFGEGIGKWWDNLEPWQKDLVGVGGGALLGGAIQKMLGGEAGAAGAVIGGLGGLAASGVVDWKALQNAFVNEKKNPESAKNEVVKTAPKK